jgi:hypothetical protein
MLILKLYSLVESAIDDVVLECVKNRDVNFDILEELKFQFVTHIATARIMPFWRQ